MRGGTENPPSRKMPQIVSEKTYESTHNSILSGSVHLRALGEGSPGERLETA